MKELSKINEQLEKLNLENNTKDAILQLIDIKTNSDIKEVLVRLDKMNAEMNSKFSAIKWLLIIAAAILAIVKYMKHLVILMSVVLLFSLLNLRCDNSILVGNDPLYGIQLIFENTPYSYREFPLKMEIVSDTEPQPFYGMEFPDIYNRPTYSFKLYPYCSAIGTKEDPKLGRQHEELVGTKRKFHMKLFQKDELLFETDITLEAIHKSTKHFDYYDDEIPILDSTAMYLVNKNKEFSGRTIYFDLSRLKEN